jgi:hypothetical protein
MNSTPTRCNGRAMEVRIQALNQRLYKYSLQRTRYAPLTSKTLGISEQ